MAQNEQSMIAQVYETLSGRIRSGTYPSGMKLPGERKLSQMFDASRGTIVEALNLLEKDRLIERVPCSGSFVAERTLRILFAFPEAAIPFDQISRVENWGIVSEVFQGMVAEAACCGAEIILQYFPEPENERDEMRQIQRLREVDGVVFSDPHRMETLRNRAISEKIPCMQLGSRFGRAFPCPVVAADPEPVFRELLQLLVRRKYRRMVMIGSMKYPQSTSLEQKRKLELMAAIAQEYDLNSELADVIFPDIKLLDFSFLQDLHSDDAVFAAWTDMVPGLFHYCAGNKLRIGHDFGVFAYASGQTFVNLHPAITYGKIDHFGIGRALCLGIVEQIHTGKTTNVFLPGKLTEGASL